MLNKKLIENLQETKKELEYTILQGQLSNFETYKFLIGKIQGLNAAIEIYQKITKETIEYE